MCRYAMSGPYKEHFACFSCRKMFRRPESHELACPPAAESAPVARCPECREPMVNLGKDFKTPKRSRVEVWQVVEQLYRRGYTFHSCGCSGPGPRPRRLRELDAFLALELPAG